MFTQQLSSVFYTRSEHATNHIIYTGFDMYCSSCFEKGKNRLCLIHCIQYIAVFVLKRAKIGCVLKYEKTPKNIAILIQCL